MTQTEMESRLDVLEREVIALKSKLEKIEKTRKGEEVPWWKQRLGFSRTIRLTRKPCV